MTQPASCPCGSGGSLDGCCGPFISGARKPETAEALMRSRYSAYAAGNVDYIVQTHDPKKRLKQLREQVEKWASQAEFTELKIVATEAGGPGDRSGVVEFEATYVEDGQSRTLHERSSFRRAGDQWYYVEGGAPKAKTVVRSQPKVGRNAPCPCGSGKKYKRCCGP